MQGKLGMGRVILALVVGAALPFLPELMTMSLGPSADLSASLGLAGGVSAGTFGILAVAGLLTAATPCVYPLIPITVGIFGARGAESRWKALALSLTYVLGICVTYSTLGLIAALTGKAFGSALSSPLVIGLLAVFLFALAASMFGAYEIALPASIQEKLSSVRGSGFAPAFAMGLVSGFVAAPCTGPVLAGVLTYVAKTGSAALGFWMLFVYAFGLGLPFIVLGVTSLRLPRSGAWMEGVKTALGVALVATGVTLVRPLFPALPELPLRAVPAAAIASALAIAAVLAGALALSMHGSAREKALKVVTVGALLLAVGLRFGWFGTPQGGLALFPKGPEIAWVSDHGKAVELAARTNKKLLVDFWATWCGACKQLDAHTWSDPAVSKEVSERFVPLKIDVTNDAFKNEVVKNYKVQGFPTVLMMPCQHKPLLACRTPEANAPGRVVEFIDARQMLERLRKIQ